MSQASIGTIRNTKELGALLDILAPTFGFTRSQGDAYAKIVGRANYRVIRKGGGGRTVIGGCALLPLGQFFGGRSVPMVGVAAVAIAPEQRGQRTATELMTAAVREMHRRRIPISSLYPATLPLYRRVGYEHAGSRFEIRVPAKSLILKSSDDGVELRAIERADERAVRGAYRQHALTTPGFLDRSDFIWHRVKSPRGQSARGVMAINSATSACEGYVFCLQKENHAPADGSHSPFSLHVTDLVALTPAAGRRLLGFFANHRSMIDQVVWQGHPDDAILKLLPERNYQARLLDHWMLRIVDVRRALEARGYPSATEGDLHIDVSDDDIIESNNGRFVLRVQGGRGKVNAGGRGDFRISIQGLAALYSGHLSPHELVQCGLAQIGGKAKRADESLQTAAAFFAGATPRLGDMF